jgi:hypothetical protein
VKRLWDWFRNLFRRKPVYVTRRILDVCSGREVEVIVDQSLFIPGMRISDIVNDIALGVKFNKPRKEILELIAAQAGANNYVD